MSRPAALVGEIGRLALLSGKIEFRKPEPYEAIDSGKLSFVIVTNDN